MQIVLEARQSLLLEKEVETGEVGSTERCRSLVCKRIARDRCFVEKRKNLASRWPCAETSTLILIDWGADVIACNRIHAI
jgi:hypothetical protein